MCCSRAITGISVGWMSAKSRRLGIPTRSDGAVGCSLSATSTGIRRSGEEALERDVLAQPHYRYAAGGCLITDALIQPGAERLGGGVLHAAWVL